MELKRKLLIPSRCCSKKNIEYPAVLLQGKDVYYDKPKFAGRFASALVNANWEDENEQMGESTREWLHGFVGARIELL